LKYRLGLLFGMIKYASICLGFVMFMFVMLCFVMFMFCYVYVCYVWNLKTFSGTSKK